MVSMEMKKKPVASVVTLSSILLLGGTVVVSRQQLHSHLMAIYSCSHYEVPETIDSSYGNTTTIVTTTAIRAPPLNDVEVPSPASSPVSRITSKPRKAPAQCLRLGRSDGDSDNDNDLEKILMMDSDGTAAPAQQQRPRKQIFIVSPAKTAGTSMKEFTSRCMNVPTHFLQLSHNRSFGHSLLMYPTDELPPIISFHTQFDNTKNISIVHELVKHSTRDTIIIYMHREETERLVSAIRHILKKRICADLLPGMIPLPAAVTDGIIVSKNSTTNECVLDESRVVKLIQSRVREIGEGSTQHLSCSTYNAMEEHAPPNMFFMHYKQANILQQLLGKHFCPNIFKKNSSQSTPSSIVMNTNEQKQERVFLKRDQAAGQGDDSNSMIVDLDTWLNGRRNLLEWFLRLKDDVSCQGMTRYMEKDLFSCPDQVIRVDDVRKWYNDGDGV